MFPFTELRIPHKAFFCMLGTGCVSSLILLSNIHVSLPLRLQATDIDVTQECPAGHGRVTCWTAYCGPDVDFSSDSLAVKPGTVPECVLYVDTFLSGEDDLPEVLKIWEELREFLEDDNYPKVRFYLLCMDEMGFGVLLR